MNDQKDLNSLSTKDKLEHFLLLSGMVVKSTKTGKEYLDLELRDHTVVRNAKMWANFDSFLPKAKVGSVVKVQGVLDEFNNQPQIKIDRIRLATSDDDVSPADFLPKSNRPIKEMELELSSRIEQISNEHLKQLIEQILNEGKFEKYKQVPAGKAWHHAYIGGLLEHTLEI